MNKSTKRQFTLGAVCLVLFAIFTVLVKTVDVKPLGYEGTDIGFSSFNIAINNVFKVNNFAYEASEWLGYVALGVAFGFALYALYQLIKTKSFKQVDKCLYELGVFYVIVVALYVIFDKVVINYRPMDMGEGLELSYPSSHTLLALCVFSTAITMFRKYFANNTTLCNILAIVLGILMMLTVYFRLVSGAHWATDILGSVILSIGLIAIFNAVFGLLEKNQ